MNGYLVLLLDIANAVGRKMDERGKVRDNECLAQITLITAESLHIRLRVNSSASSIASLGLIQNESFDLFNGVNVAMSSVYLSSINSKWASNNAQSHGVRASVKELEEMSAIP